MTHDQIQAMLAWPGTYAYVCDVDGHPTYTHIPRGTVLYKVTDEDRAAMLDRIGRCAPPR